MTSQQLPTPPGHPRLSRQEFIDRVRGTLIVSAQAPDGHPLRDTPTIAHLAAASEYGGASAIRCGGYGGLADIRAVLAAVSVPVLGLTKEGDSGVYITPTVQSAVAVAEAGAEVVAIDATLRPRQDGSTFAEQVAAVHEAGALAMADIATAEEALAAYRDGADIISTTLAGYTEHRAATPGPDLALVREVREAFAQEGIGREEVFLIGEGRYHCPADVAAGLKAGADAIIVGTAITDTAWVAKQFVAAAGAGVDAGTVGDAGAAGSAGSAGSAGAAEDASSAQGQNSTENPASAEA